MLKPKPVDPRYRKRPEMPKQVHIFKIAEFYSIKEINVSDLFIQLHCQYQYIRIIAIYIILKLFNVLETFSTCSLIYY